MARKETPSSKSVYVYEIEESLQEEKGIITIEKKINNFAIAPHGGNEDKPHFIVIGTCGEISCLSRFYQLPNFEKEKFKNLSRGGQEIDFNFAPDGHAVIIWAQFDVDHTGQSYYGQHDLRYVQLGGGNKRSKIAVFDNQISDVAWSPDSKDFIVISGKQPAVCTLYTNNCVPTFEFGRIHANTIRYSPFSNLVLLGGFGNLVGGIQIWNKDSFKIIGKNKAHCTVICEWSPDGQQIMTAVIHPRVRIDNEIKQFTYFGKKISHRKIDNSNALYFAGWQPYDSSEFTKVEIPEDFKVYDVENDPDEKEKQKPATKKGTFTLPKSTAFSAMMKNEMNQGVTSGPRKLKKDDYKEYIIETTEEKNALKAKPKPKKKVATGASWRRSGGFEIPSKVEQKAETSLKEEEERKLVPAPIEYRAPQPAQQNNQQQNKENPGKKKRRRNNRKKKEKAPVSTPDQVPKHPEGHERINQQQQQYGYNHNYGEGYKNDYNNYDY